jgi:hypothetical protein
LRLKVKGSGKKGKKGKGKKHTGVGSNELESASGSPESSDAASSVMSSQDSTPGKKGVSFNPNLVSPAQVPMQINITTRAQRKKGKTFAGPPTAGGGVVRTQGTPLERGAPNLSAPAGSVPPSPGAGVVLGAPGFNLNLSPTLGAGADPMEPTSPRFGADGSLPPSAAAAAKARRDPKRHGNLAGKHAQMTGMATIQGIHRNLKNRADNTNTIQERSPIPGYGVTDPKNV